MAKGTYGKTLGTIYDPAVGAPLDSRMMVPTFADLTAANTWKVDGGTSTESYAYYGMMVYVGNDPDSSKNGLYVLKASGSGTTTSDAKLESCWERISQTDSKIDTLQTKAITVSGITAQTVEGAFAEVADRLSGAATEGNLEALNTRVSTAETNISTVSSVVDEVSGKVDTNAAAILANTQSISALQKSIGDIVTFSVEVVESLPTTGKDKVLYLVEDASAAAGTYIEYIWVNNAFEQIGSTAIDLSGYALKTEVASVSATAKSEAIASANEYTDDKIAEVNADITSSSELITGLRTDVNAISGKADANATSITGLRTDVNTVSATAKSNSELAAGLRTDVNAVSGKADANAAAILTKAEQSAVDAVVADVQTLGADVATKANADASNIDAADWQSKLGYATATVVNGIDTRLSTAETNIETLSASVKQNAADIATKALDTDLQAVSAVVKQNAADIATKASSASVTELSGKVGDNTAAIATKAAQSDLEALSGIVNTKAAQSTVDTLSATVAGKQDKLTYYSEIVTDDESSAVNIGTGAYNINISGGIVNLNGGTDGIVLESSVDIRGDVSGTAVSKSIPAVASAVDTKLASEKAVATAIENVKSAVSTAYIYKGSKDTFAELPAEGNSVGDVWNVVAAHGNVPAGTNYAWTGEAWDALGGSVDLSVYSTTEQMNTAISTAVDTAVAPITANVDSLSSNKADVDAGNITVATWKSKLGFVTADEVSANQVQVDWNATSGVSSIANKPNIKTGTIEVNMSNVDDTAMETQTVSGIVEYTTGIVTSAKYTIWSPMTYKTLNKITIDPEMFNHAYAYQIELTIVNGFATQHYSCIGDMNKDCNVVKEVINGSDNTSYVSNIGMNDAFNLEITFTNNTSTQGLTGSTIKRCDLLIKPIVVA